METFGMFLAEIEADATAMENLAKNPPPGYPGLVTSYPDFSSAYAPAAQSVVTAYATNFPTTSLLVTVAPVIPGDVGVTLQNELIDWAKATYPDQFGTMISALYATMPPHDPPPPPLPFPKGFQMVCRAINDPARLYIDPDPVPLPAPPQPLEDALEHGVSLDAIYIEVYEGDLTPDESQPVLAAVRAKLLQNVGVGAPPPPIPLPPKNVHIL